MTASRDQSSTSIIDLLPRLRRLARTVTHDNDDADDLVAASVQRALQRLEARPPDTRFDVWMFGVMRSVWIDDLRAAQRDKHVHDDEENDERSTAEAERLHVRRAIAALPHEQGLAVALVLLEGLSYSEAATALELPLDALMSRLAHGRDALHALL